MSARTEEQIVVAEALQSLRSNSKGESTYDQKIVSENGIELDLKQKGDHRSSGESTTPEASGLPPREPKVAMGRWKKPLLSAAGLVSLSDESRGRLRYLLKMLKLANEHLSAKVNTLQESVAAEATGIEPKMSSQACHQDIVATVKKCLDVIDKVASRSLPAAAVSAVRRSVLSLPSRWAQERQNSVVIKESAVLSLAKEALNMISAVTTIVSGTLDKADSWCSMLVKRRKDNTQDSFSGEQPPAKEQKLM